MNAEKIPLVDVRAQYSSIKPEIDDAITRVLNAASFVGGAEVSAFEGEFADYCGVHDCAAVGNGTDAIVLSLRAARVGHGDEVITVSHTFLATAEAIVAVGATPVLVDIRPDTMLMDPVAAAAAVTSRTKAIVPVHLYGQCCDMEAIGELAARYNLLVIEDAAQAHGACFNGVRAGALGNLACFSFYPGKNLGAYGDGGAVVGRDSALVSRVRRLANHGRLEKYVHDEMGTNSRLDTLQAAILRVKLRHLDQWNAARRRLASDYYTALEGADLVLPVIDTRALPVWHLFVVCHPARDRIRETLRERGIDAGVHYPTPVHRQPAWDRLGLSRPSLPVTETVAARVLSLPLYPELRSEDLIRVADAVRASVNAVARA